MNTLNTQTYQRPLIVAARDTLMNIAGVSGVSALRLTPDLSLAKNLGYSSAEFFALAKYQCKVGDRLRSDGRKTVIDSAELQNLQVWQVYALTVLRAVGITLDQSEAESLIALALVELQGGGP